MDTDKLKKIADRLLYTAQVNGGTMGHEMHVCATQINELIEGGSTSYPNVSECKLRGEIVRLHDQLKKAKSIVIQLLDDWDDEADRRWNWGRLFEVLDIKRETVKETRQDERELTDECCKR